MPEPYYHERALECVARALQLIPDDPFEERSIAFADHLSAEELAEHLEAAARILRKEICRDCDGEGCETCDGQGEV